jgi:hypothetical protein
VLIKGEEKRTTLIKKREFLAVARIVRVTANRERRILPPRSEATFSLRKAKSKLALISSVCKEMNIVYKRLMGLSYYQRKYLSFD